MNKKKLKKSQDSNLLVLFLVAGFLLILFYFGSFDGLLDSSDSDVFLEMTTEQLFSEFDGLSEIQAEERAGEFKGKRIKTSIYVSRINKATLSSQYVVMEMWGYPYSMSPAIKAFFPSGEKEELLKVDIGDTIVLIGEFVNYNRGALTSYIEFTKSDFIEIKKVE